MTYITLTDGFEVCLGLLTDALKVKSRLADFRGIFLRDLKLNTLTEVSQVLKCNIIGLSCNAGVLICSILLKIYI